MRPWRAIDRSWGAYICPRFPNIWELSTAPLPEGKAVKGKGAPGPNRGQVPPPVRMGEYAPSNASRGSRGIWTVRGLPRHRVAILLILQTKGIHGVDWTKGPHWMGPIDKTHYRPSIWSVRCIIPSTPLVHYVLSVRSALLFLLLYPFILLHLWNCSLFDKLNIKNYRTGQNKHKECKGLI